MKLRMVPPPVLPPGKWQSQSPPGRRSTVALGVSQVIKPSLVVKAFQTSGSGAGIVRAISRTSPDGASAFAGMVGVAAFVEGWAARLEATRARTRKSDFMVHSANTFS